MSEKNSEQEATMSGRKLIKKYARAYAPPTVSNVGPGFDLMGFSIHSEGIVGDEVTVTANDVGEVRIVSILGNTSLSSEVEKNTAGMAIKAFIDEQAPGEGVDIILNKRMPVGSGLGSSASSAVAGVMAVNGLLAEPLPKERLIEYAMQGEMVASGTRHGDNVIPALMGGFVVINNPDKLQFFRIEAPVGLRVMTIHPHIEIKTSEAREILPKNIPTGDSIRQTGAAMSLVTGLLTSDFSKIQAASDDFIAEPYRSKLIPGYAQIKEMALAAGAIAFNISGSGPTMFALFNADELSVKKAEGNISLKSEADKAIPVEGSADDLSDDYTGSSTNRFAESLPDGLSEDLTGGMAEGFTEGLTNGLAEGFTDDLTEGFKDGLTNNFAEGSEEINTHSEIVGKLNILVKSIVEQYRSSGYSVDISFSAVNSEGAKLSEVR
ncbi:MAG: homoserine kinase [Ignavibacteriales bacterium]|nr:MAG: homoserine kinase [Ignavibacteriaceae bacterium]MBW7873125.1 homoserine kinase [Ignavibacteria bacterium]MCZ2142768.1 homoserine kinase [Ignavibacteriales bacterium]MBV6443862.1 Homoserine kinase [Ignavibacteriaceae bacterium]MBZ0196295.1 homoserine kinase [Ignavibacteriaceae bacterium]